MLVVPSQNNHHYTIGHRHQKATSHGDSIKSMIGGKWCDTSRPLPAAWRSLGKRRALANTGAQSFSGTGHHNASNWNVFLKTMIEAA